MPNNNNNHTAEMQRIKNRIVALSRRMQNIVHGRTGVRQPRLANTVNFDDPITFNTVPLENAWYITKNVDEGKIFQVYAKNSLNKLLSQPNPRSLIKRQPISRANIRRVLNHSQNGGVAAPAHVAAPATHVVHASLAHALQAQAPPTTQQHPHTGSYQGVRVPHGPFTITKADRLKFIFTHNPGNLAISVKFKHPGPSAASRLIIRKTGATFSFSTRSGGMIRSNVSLTNFSSTFVHVVTQLFNANIHYVGYVRL